MFFPDLWGSMLIGGYLNTVPDYFKPEGILSCQVDE